MRNPCNTPEGRRFSEVFGPSVIKFWCPVTGFDVVKFDEWAGTPKGVSCNDHIERKFGKGSASIIKALIAQDPLLRVLGKL